MKRLNQYIFLLIGELFLISSAQAVDSSTVQNSASAEILAGSCIACHGPSGSSLDAAVPSIAGFSKEYLLKVLKDSITGAYPSTIMGRIMTGYSDADIETLADYFSRQTPMIYPQTTDVEKVQWGAKLHKQYCERCHENDGKVDEGANSILAGQRMLYLQLTLADFQAGVRAMDTKMKKQMDRLFKENRGKEELAIQSLIHFYGSQR